ncbi:MAG: hypothetical protein NTW75_09855 [Planctomycetales bacterium]|nr:hypothetical protein [Planctomycetales bacterium]
MMRWRGSPKASSRVITCTISWNDSGIEANPFPTSPRIIDAVTTCHWGNISMRLGREMRWDAGTEQIVGDDEADSWQKREQRPPYQFPVSSPAASKT